MGADKANDVEFRRDLLAKLDRIIGLLTPPSPMPYRPSTPGWTCGRCSEFVPSGRTHQCGLLR